MIRVKQATKQGYEWLIGGGVCDLNYPSSKTRRGRVQNYGKILPTICSQNTTLYRIDKLERITDMGLENVAHVTLPDENGVEYDYYIRKLTPRETWRGMGFSDEDFEKAEKVNSSSQLYKQAGNSIVKQCLMAIFRELLPDEDNYSDLRQLIGSL